MEHTTATRVCAARVARSTHEKSARRGSGRILSATAAIGATEVALVGISLACLLLVVTSGLLAAERPAPAFWTTTTVSHADTLWDLAREYPVPGLSTSQTVDLILSHNGLSSATLLVGQSVTVPAGESALSVADRR